MNSPTVKKSLMWAVPAALMLGATVVSAPAALSQDAAAPTEAAPATDKVPPAEEKFSQGVLFPYPLLAAALHERMDKNGAINFLKLQGDANLATFIRALASADLTQFPVHTVEVEDPKNGKKSKKDDHSAELTFWINAYNAHMLKTVSDAYPLKSPYDIKDLDTAKTHEISGKKYSFKELREKITKMDKRAFFTLIDATEGGPRLPTNGVYWYADLNARLEDAVQAFVRSSRNVEVNTINKVVNVSEHFKAADALFKTGGGRDRYSGIRAVLTSYSDGFNQKFLIAQHYELRFMPAEKSLNDRTDTSPVG